MDPIIGMIILWGTSAPRIPNGWVPCDGRQMTIQQYAALYSLIGTYYGGDGRTYFNVPDLRSRVPVGIGQGTGLSNYTLAQQGGIESVALTPAQLPVHNHLATAVTALTGSANLSASGSLQATQSPGTSDTPGPNLFPAMTPDYVAEGLTPDFIYGASDGSTTMPVNIVFPQNPAPVAVTGTVNVAVQPAGTNQAHTNLQPFLGMQYLIAWDGIYPDFN